MRHRRLALLAATALLAVPAAALAETWSNAPLVDGMCIKKVRENPDSHTRECAIKCVSGGYGILTADGAYLQLDSEGTSTALAALKASDKKDHLRVDVKGTLEGNTIHVETLALAK